MKSRRGGRQPGNLGKICACKEIVMPGEEHSCAALRAASASDARRRASKNRAHGLNRRSWRDGLRLEILDRDGRICQLQVDKGCTGTATTVHLRPELAGNHALATVADGVAACSHCHGIVDGRRSRDRAT